jgi:hypothetical protein
MSVPWYEQIADMHSAHERDEFVKGMFSSRPHSQHSFLIGLLAGYASQQLLSKAMKKSRRENR